MIVWINLKLNRWCLNSFLPWASKTWDVEQQVQNKSRDGSIREESLNDENLSLSKIFLCGPRGLVTHILHIYILYAYIQCNYALAHKHLEEFLLHFKGFQSANLGNTTDISGRLGDTLIFKIIANAFMKERLFLARLGQEPPEGCRNGSKVYIFQSVPIFNSHCIFILGFNCQSCCIYQLFPLGV